MTEQPGVGSDYSPEPQIVNLFHTNDDRDAYHSAHHHTLGLDKNQASPGNHNHNGSNSKLPLVGRTTGFPSVASNPPTQSEVQACIDALRELGAGQS